MEYYGPKKRFIDWGSILEAVAYVVATAFAVYMGTMAALIHFWRILMTLPPPPPPIIYQ